MDNPCTLLREDLLNRKPLDAQATRPFMNNRTSSTASANKKIWRVLRSATFRSLLGLGLLAYILYSVGSKDLLATLSQISLAMVGYLLLLTVVLLMLSVFKWQVILREFGVVASLGDLTKHYLVGYFINSFLPSSIGGDVVRSYKLGKEAGHLSVFSATILERYSGLVTMLLMALVAVALFNFGSNKVPLLVFFASAGVIVGSIIGLSRSGVRTLKILRIPERIITKAVSLREALLTGSKRPAFLITIVVLSILFHLGAVLNTHAAGVAVGWDAPPLLSLLAVVPVVLIVTGIPLTPGNLGLTEGAFYYFLTMVGASPSQAVATALVLRAKSVLLAVIGGLVVLKEGAKR